MASSTTYLNQATLATGATFLTVSGYTAPAGRPKPIGQMGDERMLIVDSSLSPTLQVVRGYQGTQATGHNQYEPFIYGTPSDMPVSKGTTQLFPTETSPTIHYSAQEITATGTTGTNAALVNVPPPAFITISGAANSGVNLPYPQVGDSFTLKNLTTGTVKIYSIGSGTINGNSGATGFSLTATGNLMVDFYCSTAGAWQAGGNT